jgi:capsular polysaccharide transport system ATP-binding protein
MSVELYDITMKGEGPGLLFDDLNLRVDVGERVGILGQPKSGKSTLLRLIGGVEPIYKGFIERSSHVSWVLPFGDYLVPSNTVATNIRFLGRLYGTNDDRFLHEVAEMAGVTEFLNEELASCPRFVRSQLNFALAICVKFDIYLFDDFIMNGEKTFKEKAIQIAQSLVPRQGFVFASSTAKDVAANCDTVYILDKGHLTHYEDMKEAEKHFKSLAQGTVQDAPVKQETREQAEEDYSSVLGI